ncbi:MAG: CxxxxCH/CxxCH domain-containing protein [Pseudomonadota bacterium]
MKKINVYAVCCFLFVAMLMPLNAGAQVRLDFEPPHVTNVDNMTQCYACHLPAGSGTYLYFGLKPLPRGTEQEALCKTCHNPTGEAASMSDVGNHRVMHGGDNQTIDCSTCHDPHAYSSSTDPHNGTTADNLMLVRSTIKTDRVPGTLSPLIFQQSPAHFAFAEASAPYDGVCQACHTETGHHRNNASSDHTHMIGTDCTGCHSHDLGFLPGAGACDACHGAPPATGAHVKHFGGTINEVSYGGTGNLSTVTEYVFQCGLCHPLSTAKHMNGTVDVELYNNSSPPGSLKSLNPPNATYEKGATTYTDANGLPYTLGTCSNVYCHSKTDWSSPDPISNPIVSAGLPVLDTNGNLTYDPYTVTESKVYVPVGWGDAPRTCSGCHNNPPMTAYPQVQAGVGNSHQWIDSYGYGNLHAWNMQFDPLMCRTCHYTTVTEISTWSRDTHDVTTFGNVPIANKAYHVNGVKDVAFDVNPVLYSVYRGTTTTFSLASTVYNPSTKGCSSVPCHLAQKKPQWGKPYRWENSIECDYCHKMGSWPSLPSGKIVERSALQQSAADHQSVASQNCIDCHDIHR